MNAKKLLLLSLLAPVGACLDWSLAQPAGGPIDCSLYSNAAQRYPGICGLDAGAAPDGPQPIDGGVSDGGMSHGG